MAFLLLVILVFSLVGNLIRAGGDTPEEAIAAVLDFTAARTVGTAYPFIFPLIAVLVTLAIVLERKSGGLAALQAQGLQRWEILVSHNIAIFLLVVVAALGAFVVLPFFAEPALASQGRLTDLFPLRYWASMPRLFMTLLFIILLSAAFAFAIRNPAVAFGAMITFFFIGWFVQAPLGQYAVLTPPVAFRRAYRYDLPDPEGLPFLVADLYIIYLAAAFIAFVASLLYVSRRGEML